MPEATTERQQAVDLDSTQLNHSEDGFQYNQRY